MQIQAILIDDEPDCLDLLNWQIANHCPELKVIAQCSSAADGLETIRSAKPDVVFLDVEMPFMNGFQLLEQLPEINFDLIFTTAYDRYAIRAIRYSALDYLLKPIVAAELRGAVHRLIEKRQDPKRENAMFETLLHNLRQTGPQRIFVTNRDGMFYVEIPQLVFLQANNNYTFLHLKNQKRLLVPKTLKHFEDVLEGSGFFRVHASYLINRAEISSLNKQGSLSVQMSDGSEIPIARAKREQFLRML